jgi:hypothetical protein
LSGLPKETQKVIRVDCGVRGEGQLLCVIPFTTIDDLERWDHWERKNAKAFEKEE